MKLTREGKRFFLATALIAVAAVNTGNNLIYLILSLMLSFAVLSYIILRINLSALLLDVSCNGPVFAGEPVVAEILIRNNKNIPAYSCTICATDTGGKIYCGYIPGWGAANGNLRMVFKKRGLYGYRDFSIQSGFPFILFQKSVSVQSQEMCWFILLFSILRDKLKNSGLMKIRGRGLSASKGDDVYSLREYQYGDPEGYTLEGLCTDVGTDREGICRVPVETTHHHHGQRHAPE